MGSTGTGAAHHTGAPEVGLKAGDCVCVWGVFQKQGEKKKAE